MVRWDRQSGAWTTSVCVAGLSVEGEVGALMSSRGGVLGESTLSVWSEGVSWWARVARSLGRGTTIVGSAGAQPDQAWLRLGMERSLGSVRG